MARRSRSLSELPGHLRVPILKRKDTERTQARLQAGLAGMEELRELREHQQQLIGDTMARVENRQQRLHSLPRRHGDNSLMTSTHPKMSRSTGQTNSISHHDSISSWQSTSSLTSISEEGDTLTSCDTDANKSGLYERHNDYKIRDNYKNLDKDSESVSNRKGCEMFPQKRQLSRSQSNHEGTTRPWKSQEHICERPKPKENLQSPIVFQSPNEAGKRSVHRSMSFSISSSAGHHLSNGHALSSNRRNSTSMIHDLQSGDLTRSYLSHILHTKGNRLEENQRRYPLTSISNVCVPASGESTNLHGQNYHSDETSSEDRNCNQISWDKLLKTIGISNSASSLTSLVEDENSDQVDDVFHSVESKEENISDTETPPPLPDKRPCHKMGRSFSFCHGNTVQNSSKYSQLFFRERGGSSFDEEEDAASSQSYPYSGQSFQPIMRRASMQCEAVLTKSGIAKRRVNPIQDVDINTLTNPGPVHAVMLQYTSPKVGASSNTTNGSNTDLSKCKMRNSKVKDETQFSESEHKYLKIACRKRGNECKLVKTGTEFQELQLNANKCGNQNGHVPNGGYYVMNIADSAESGASERQDIEYHSREPKEKLEDSSNIGSRTSKDKIVKMEITPLVTVRENSARGSCDDYMHEPSLTPADAHSKTSSNSIDSVPTVVRREKENYYNNVKIGMQNLNSSEEVEFSKKENIHGKSQGDFDPCFKESDSIEVSVGCSKLHSCLNKLSNGQQTMNCEVNGSNTHSCPSLACKLLHPEGVEKAPSKNRIGSKDHMASTSRSLPADLEIDDNEDGHVIKYSQGDVSKTSSDVSIISDEGYSTCESLVSTTKACLQSKGNELNNLLNSSSVSGLISSVGGDTLRAKIESDQESVAEQCVGECGLQEIPNLCSQSHGQAESGKKQNQYDDVAFLDTGVDPEWNPKRCKNSTKSLHRCVFVYKSLKQTAV